MWGDPLAEPRSVERQGWPVVDVVDRRHDDPGRSGLYSARLVDLLRAAFAAQKGGFGGDATGGDRTYGNNLAAFYVRNADRLAVLYVIWYRQIWLPSSGCKSYSGANGDPSSDHTNHVHLSIN